MKNLNKFNYLRYQMGFWPCFKLNPAQKIAQGLIKNKIVSGYYKTIFVTCPLCESDKPNVLSKMDMYGFPTQISLCNHCGLVYTQERLSLETIPLFYNEHYRQLDRGTYFPGEAYFNLQQQKGTIIENLLLKSGIQLKTDAVVAEIGCGAGGTLAYFKNKGYRVYGCDLGGEYLNYGRSEHGLELYKGDSRSFFNWMSENKINIDLLIYEQVFEHLPDPLFELKSITEHIKNDFILYIGVPGIKNIHHQYESNFLRYLQIPHLIHYDLASLTAILDKGGYKMLNGNEQVHALFAPSLVFEKLLPLPPAETLSYLHAIEREWRVRWFKKLPITIMTVIGSGLKNKLRKIPWLFSVLKFIFGTQQKNQRISVK